MTPDQARALHVGDRVISCAGDAATVIETTPVRYRIQFDTGETMYVYISDNTANESDRFILAPAV